MDGVVHFEIPAEDLDRAKEFYASAFGWTTYTVPMGDSDYITVTTVPVDRSTMTPTHRVPSEDNLMGLWETARS